MVVAAQRRHTGRRKREARGGGAVSLRGGNGGRVYGTVN